MDGKRQFERWRRPSDANNARRRSASASWNVGQRSKPSSRLSSRPAWRLRPTRTSWKCFYRSQAAGRDMDWLALVASLSPPVPTTFDHELRAREQMQISPQQGDSNAVIERARQQDDQEFQEACAHMRKRLRMREGEEFGSTDSRWRRKAYTEALVELNRLRRSRILVRRFASLFTVAVSGVPAQGKRSTGYSVGGQDSHSDRESICQADAECPLSREFTRLRLRLRAASGARGVRLVPTGTLLVQHQQMKSIRVPARRRAAGSFGCDSRAAWRAWTSTGLTLRMRWRTSFTRGISRRHAHPAHSKPSPR